MDKDQVYEAACQAIERLVDDLGINARFPFDQIRSYSEEEIPGTYWRLLEKEGYIEPTGNMTKTVTPERRSTVTREYRPGPRFQPKTLTRGAIVEAIRELQKAMDAQGLITTPVELANLYLAMMTSPIVILAGLSGTGKSWIPRVFAQLIGASFSAISVQPQWSDNADLFGYTPSLNPSNFVEGDFTRALKIAKAEPEKPTIVLLDEMNLAAVEHYFSDFLSVVETRRRENDTIVTDPLPLDLPGSCEVDAYQDLRALYLPPNVRVIGTANMDETTRTFSPKVIDRAFVIEFDDVDLTAFPSYTQEEVKFTLLPSLATRLIDLKCPVAVREVYEEGQGFFNRIAGLLEEVRQILRPSGISFGYRTRDAILLYMWHWRNDSLTSILAIDAAFDLCVLQKILPKVTGTGEALYQSLEQLRDWLHAEHGQNILNDDGSIPMLSGPFERSAEKVERMLQRLEIEGATTYWGI